MDYLKKLLEALKVYGGKFDVPIIENAFRTAEEAHRGQVRIDGDPYISHPVEVAIILSELGMDTETLTAAILHDVVEDTQVTLAEVVKTFGDETARLVDGVTKLTKIPYSSREEQQAENIRKMLMAVAEDVRVIIIKLADRLHNMRTIGVRLPQKQRDTALETMEVYAPLAHRLGIRTIQEELEDLSLRYLDNIGYAEINALLDSNAEQRGIFLDDIQALIAARLGAEYPSISIEGRVKSLYGIYRKMFIDNRSFDEIYDIFAVRIIVDTPTDCYHVLGEIHDMFRPIPNRFKDYISTPKPNMYQSLHTTLLDKHAIPFEVQIRTWEMHYTSEYGIAAHWKYKEGSTNRGSLDEKIAWVRQILEAQKTAVDSQELLGSIKTDLSTDEVYIYTPKGDLIALPLGATVIDFAYAIHSEVGNSMVGAKIDGRMVSLDTEVKTGHVVNIITTNAADHGPNRGWLEFVRTSSARNKIRSWFRKERREENIEEGRALFTKELRRQGLLVPKEFYDEFVDKIAKRQRITSDEELYNAIGYGGITLSKLMPRAKEIYDKDYKVLSEKEAQKELEKITQLSKEQTKTSSSVIVEGVDDILVKFAKCCSPLPGDPIVGYVTRGSGVSVHQKKCINAVLALEGDEQQARWVRCDWAPTYKEQETFKSTIEVLANDRDALLLDISIALNSMRLPIYSLNAREIGGGETSTQITFGVSGLGQLDYAIKTLGKIAGVHRVIRVTQ